MNDRDHTHYCDNQGICHYCGIVMEPEWYAHYIRPKLASNTFTVDRTYTRKRIAANSASFIETATTLAALVKNVEPFVDVVFEFARVGGGNKWKCFAIGKADRHPLVAQLRCKTKGDK